MLHVWEIAAAEYERHERRRGRRHAFEQVEAAQTALVVVDMVPFFVEENPYARGIVPNIARLARAFRTHGGTVAWVVPSTAPLSSSRTEFYGPSVAELYRASGGEGSIRERLWDEFELDDDDMYFEKTTPGAFFPGGCDLSNRLGDRGVETVIVAGTVANVCCESTVRDAASAGFRVVMVADANAAMNDSALNATLTTVYRSFGDVRTTSEIVGLLSPERPVGDRDA